MSIAGKIKFGSPPKGQAPSSAQALSLGVRIETKHGIYIGGNVDSGGGDFLGRDTFELERASSSGVKSADAAKKGS